MTLTIGDVIERALAHNLGVLVAETNMQSAGGARWSSLSELLPHVTGDVSASRRKSSLEAFGLPLGPEFPRVVGPYNVFDARIAVSQRLLDVSALHEVRASAHREAAAGHSYRSARDLVVLVAANLYLEVLAADAHAASARAQLDTATALHAQAQTLRASGLVAGLDVIRAEVTQRADQQRATAADNAFQLAQLRLARVMGLPVGQAFAVEPVVPDIPVPDMSLDEALERAYRDRPDYLAALERVEAAEAARRAVASEALPSARVTADYGAIGLTPGSALTTYTVTGAIDVPIFEGGRRHGRLAQADAELRQRRAEADDLRGEIYYDVRSAFLELKSTEEQLRTAAGLRQLADQQLAQSRDRFAAGIASSLEIVQAQEAVALASEQYINAFYGSSLAKAMLGRSVGTAEDAVRRYLGGAIVR